MENKKVAILMGSDSDYGVMKDALNILRKFGVEFEVSVISAHRTPERAMEFAKNAETQGFSVVIAGAGKAAHLPGVIAALTTLPVIGVPIKSSALDGLDALLSIVQMPPGVPVATVAIDGAKNAALLAVEIMALNDPGLKAKLKEYRESMAREVVVKDEKIKDEVKNV
ncbi:5-(carboxyamino)imidazole ribonucleotide mutase [Thermosediminibacter litoriperuensis]|uniref:N5-carboxyaminoimidazole ribonucleotide mutase n=1 Tax=Thermosediminibacter litoriperuensis TaxID=291989 RepID=A0A5S5AYU5_9FIRM|nr:5-(carboxyamino)imidazole ribonucleotide mutase [Thermosediminibacter litoriperuensis]TYP58519.1 5-(carboxyamino)imidazole ribonucleotide mutase [Thermosediminibacter litoriperuensis]